MKNLVWNGVALSLLLLAGCPPAPAQSQTPRATDRRATDRRATDRRATAQPNILWITCEDMSPHLGSYGERVAQTPHLDRLAAEGIRYTNVYSVAGVCAPSRSALITGMYPTSIGTQHMRTLSASSAHGKMPDGVIPYSAVIPPQVKCFSEYLRQAGYYCTNNAKTDYQFHPPFTAWDENGKTGHWRNRPAKDTPFFAVFNLEITHESQVWMRENEPLLVQPEAVELPPFYPDNAATRRDVARFLTNVQRMDAQVGQILQQLRDDGLYDNTIIFFYADHGDGLPYFKRELYDRGLRVPLLVRFPSAEGAGRVDTDLHSFVDFAPTVLSLAGVPIPVYMQGQAFLGPQRAATPRRYIYAARDRMDLPTDRVRAVRDGRFKYVRNYHPEKPEYQDILYRLQQPMMREWLKLHEEGKLTAVQSRWFRPSKPAEELYDCGADPYELTNLVGQPAHGAKLRELRQALDGWMGEVGDLSAEPESVMLARMWPNLRQPATAPPVAALRRNNLTLTCPTEGASIGYRVGDGPWRVYGGPVEVPKGAKVTAKAVRIGYTPSDEITATSR